jgi:hypothetical protein
MKGLIVIVLLAGFAWGCAYGMTKEKFRPAQSPRGVEASITTLVAEFAGELIEIRQTGLVLLSEKVISPTRNGPIETADRRLRLIPYAAVLLSRFDQLDKRVYIVAGRMPTGDGREQLRLVSRFPQGLSPEVLSQLLKEHGQTELAGIQP